MAKTPAFTSLILRTPTTMYTQDHVKGKYVHEQYSTLSVIYIRMRILRGSLEGGGGVFNRQLYWEYSNDHTPIYCRYIYFGVYQ